MICTLSSAHWQQDSKLSALRRFELIWKDCDKCANQCNTIQYNTIPSFCLPDSVNFIFTMYMYLNETITRWGIYVLKYRDR